MSASHLTTATSKRYHAAIHFRDGTKGRVHRVMLSLILAEKILSLFVMMAMGFALVKAGFVKPQDSRAISMLNLYVINPCMIISSFQVDMTQEVRLGFLVAIIGAVATQGLFLVLTTVFKKPLKLDEVEQASLTYSNCGNLIIPLVVMIMGQDMVIYCTAYLVVQTILLWSHGKSLMRGVRGIDWRQVLLGVNMISVYIGLLLFITGLRLPEPVQLAMSSVGSMIGPSAMIVTGMIMAGVNFRELLSFKRLPFTAIMRLIVLPLIGLAILKFTPLASLAPNGENVLLITLLAASAPSASTINQMAQIYNRNASYASAINVVTILCCIVTMPLMVFLYQL